MLHLGVVSDYYLKRVSLQFKKLRGCSVGSILPYAFVVNAWEDPSGIDKLRGVSLHRIRGLSKKQSSKDTQ